MSAPQLGWNHNVGTKYVLRYLNPGLRLYVVLVLNSWTEGVVHTKPRASIIFEAQDGMDRNAQETFANSASSQTFGTYLLQVARGTESRIRVPCRD